MCVNTRMRSTLSASDLSMAELMSARLDGEVYSLGESWCPIDEIDGPPVRAASLAPLVPRRAIIERLSAAWVYSLVPEPAQHEFCVDLDARAHTHPSPRLHLREVVCPGSDTEEIGGVRVTTPLRTVIDLARWAPALCEDELSALLLALLRYGGHSDTALARQRCEAKSVPNRTVALTRLLAVEHLLRSCQPKLPVVAVSRRGWSSLLAVTDPVHVINGVDTTHGVQNPVKVGDVPHLEDEPAQGEAVTGCIHRGRQNIDVVL